MVTFDIPEKLRYKRRNLRLLLRELSFKQVQKSVWVTDLDAKNYLQMNIKQEFLEPYVKIYEVSEIN